MTELELIVKKLDKIGTELYNKFGTESYDIRCELHDIKDQLKAINYSRCCKSDSEQLKDKQELSFDEWTKKNKYTVIAPTLYKKGLEYINIESLNRQYKKHLNL